MAKHDVTFEVPPRPVSRNDIRFTVRSDGSVFGTLEVSKGSIVWFPKGTTKGLKMGWQRFHEIMQEHASTIERR